MNRRDFLNSGVALVATTPLSAAADVPFDPQDWLDRRKLGRIGVKTPQSGKELQPLAAKTLQEWDKERKLYELAFRELIGPWPAERPALQPRVYEEKAFPKWTRFKVGFQSLPSKQPRVSEMRAWLFVPKGGKPPLPGLITLHQTVPQGKDEPGGIKATLPWLTFATYWAERGYVTLAPDMVGYGERTTGGYERTGFELSDAAPILDAHADLTLLGLMLYDVTRAIDYLVQRDEVDPKRIGVAGHSLGGILVNMVLGLEPRLRVGVASCGYGTFRKDTEFAGRWAAGNSAYLPRLHLYKKDRADLPIDLLQILALAAPRAHLIQTALGDTIWTLPAVADDGFICGELKRIREFYGKQAVDEFVSIQVAGGAKDRNHGWYPECQKAADELLKRVLEKD